MAPPWVVVCLIIHPGHDRIGQTKIPQPFVPVAVTSVFFGEYKIPRRDHSSEPDTVFGSTEHVPILIHGQRIDGKNYRLPVTLADFDRG